MDREGQQKRGIKTAASEQKGNSPRLAKTMALNYFNFGEKKYSELIVLHAIVFKILLA